LPEASRDDPSHGYSEASPMPMIRRGSRNSSNGDKDK
jgi:hypothetical protein